MRPVASPTFTARTTGLMKMKCHPSLSSWKACPKSILGASACFSRTRALGRVSREIITAENTKVRASA